MGLKESGLRGSLRNVSTGVIAIPDSELTHHFDASLLSGTDGDTITTFPDSAGTNDATGDGTLRTDAVNGENVIELNGSQNFENANSSPVLSQPVTIFAVWNSATDTGDQQTAIGFNNDSDGLLLFQRPDSSSASGPSIFAGNPVDAGQSNGSFPTRIDAGIFDGSNSAIRTDGVERATGNVGSQSDNGSFSIGSRFDGSAFLNGQVCEILVYDRKLDPVEIDQVESFLSDKWGITI